MEIGSVAIGDARDICVATKWRLWRHLVAAFLLYVGIGVLPDVVPTATPLCWPNTRKVILLVKGKQIESWFIKLHINDYEIIIKTFWLNNYLNNQPWNYILVGLVEISPCNLVFRALLAIFTQWRHIPGNRLCLRLLISNDVIRSCRLRVGTSWLLIV